MSTRNGVSTGKVALVESDAQIVEILRSPFEEAGFQVEAATTAEEGLALCRQFLPQVAMIDTELPDGDGLKVAKALHEAARTRHINVILLARSLNRELKIAALETGADDFIVIPFDPDEVTLRVRNAIRRATSDNLTDPVTALPSGRLIQARLRELVGVEEGWALLGLMIRYMEPFEEVHGFLAAQEVLRSVARVLVEGCDRWGTADDFIGHNGGSRFVIVTSSEQASALVEGLTKLFEQESLTHYTFRERERGYMLITEGGEEKQVSLMRLDIQKVLATDGPFYDIRSLTEELGQ